MPGTVITDLRRRRGAAVDPGRLLAGPLRVVGLQWLEPGRSAEVTAEGVEHALYVTAGSGLAALPEDVVHPDHPERADTGLPLVEGTAVVLPLGARTVLIAGTAGLEYFHAVLAVPTGVEPSAEEAEPSAREAERSPDEPSQAEPSQAGPPPEETSPEEGDPR